MTREEIRMEKARNLRYKRPALASMGQDAIYSELSDISEACDNISYYVDQDNDTLLNDLLGDEEEAFEFRMAFADLSGKVSQLQEALYEAGWDNYDDCTVALIGNRYRMVGFDSYEEDYFGLTGYDSKLAQTEAGKRLMRLTKSDMLSTIGQSVGILLAFLDVRQAYDYLKAAIDVLRGSNSALLRQIKEVDEAYEAAAAVNFRTLETATKRLDDLTMALPDVVWLG